MLQTIAFVINATAMFAGFLAAGRTQGLAGRPPGPRLRALGLLAAGALTAAHLGGVVRQPAAAQLLLGVTLAPALGAGAAMVASLTLAGGGRRWLRLVAAPFAGLAGLALLAGAPITAAAGLLLPVTLRMPWLDRKVGLGTRALLFAGAILAIALGPSAAARVPHLGSGTTKVLGLAASPIFAFAASLLLKLFIQFPGRIFSRFRLRTRLLTSYILVAAIPVVLIAAFLMVAAYLIMGSYRATLAARFLVPGAESRQGLERMLTDPGLGPALADSPGSGAAGAVRRDSGLARDGELDRLAREHLPKTVSFLMALRRDLPDTTHFTLAWTPRDSVPQILASSPEYLPPDSLDAILFAGEQVFSSTAVAKKDSAAEIALRAFSPLTPDKTIAAQGTLKAEIGIVVPDSMTQGKNGIVISMDDGTAPGPPRWIVSTTKKSRGTYAGAQVLRGFQILPSGHIIRRDALVLVKFPASDLVGILRDTQTNPFSVVVLIALAVIGGLFLLVETAALVTGGTIARNIHRSVSLLHQATRRLAEDDFDHRLEVDRGDELGELAGSFNIMSQGLKERRRLALEHEHMQAELLVARTIQRRLLPSRVPDIPGLDVAGTSIPSREVGGDAYDFLRWDDRLLISVADVAGKGVPAAILMSNLQAGLRSQVNRSGALGQVLAELNGLVLASTDPGQFITLAIALIDPRDNSLTYANAGHNPPLLRRADGCIETLSDGGILLGVLAGAPYEESRVNFAPGDVAVLFTDGVVEATDAEGAFFGDDRLVELLRGTGGLDAAAIRDRIVHAVEEFTPGGGLVDDLTVVVARRLEDGTS